MIDATVHRRAPFLQVVDLSAEQCHASSGKRDVRQNDRLSNTICDNSGKRSLEFIRANPILGCETASDGERGQSVNLSIAGVSNAGSFFRDTASCREVKRDFIAVQRPNRGPSRQRNDFGEAWSG